MSTGNGRDGPQDGPEPSQGSGSPPDPFAARTELLVRLGGTWRDDYEPSAWLRMRAEAAALALAADGVPFRPGSRVIVPLIPTPTWAAERSPAHWCARCGAFTTATTRPEPGAWKSCGFEATSGVMPDVLLAFTLELCRACADREWPQVDTEVHTEGLDA